MIDDFDEDLDGATLDYGAMFVLCLMLAMVTGVGACYLIRSIP